MEINTTEDKVYAFFYGDKLPISEISHAVVRETKLTPLLGLIAFTLLGWALYAEGSGNSVWFAAGACVIALYNHMRLSRIVTVEMKNGSSYTSIRMGELDANVVRNELLRLVESSNAKVAT